MNIVLPKISGNIQTYLLHIARESLIAAVKKTSMQSAAEIPELPQEKYGCFVTLTKRDRLRGCIGYIEGYMPLNVSVIENARSAALEDPRFNPVTEEELSEISIEISVLTSPNPLIFKNEQDLLQQLVPGEDGIVLQKGSRKSTFLPQVWEQLPEKIMFMEQLAVKAGLPSSSWSSADIKRYRVLHFNEIELRQ